MAYDHRSAIGIDLGGTRIKAGLVDVTGRVFARRTVPTEAQGGPDHVIARIIDLVRALRDEASAHKLTPIGVGVGAPGALSQRRGVILAPPNLPGWKEVPIAARVADGAALSTHLENDANAAALGECWTGAAQGVRDMVMITLGTGVGGGVVQDGRILRGHFETAGEIGHTIVQLDGRPCGCGQRGCLEAYASAAHVARRVTEEINAGKSSQCAEPLRRKGEIDARDVAAAAAAGDTLAADVWDEACRFLALTIVNMQHVLNPQMVLLAGGMSAAGAALLDPVQRHFRGMTWKAISDAPEIGLAKLGDDAGFVGAAAIAFEESGLAPPLLRDAPDKSPRDSTARA